MRPNHLFNSASESPIKVIADPNEIEEQSPVIENPEHSDLNTPKKQAESSDDQQSLKDYLSLNDSPK